MTTYLYKPTHRSDLTEADRTDDETGEYSPECGFWYSMHASLGGQHRVGKSTSPASVPTPVLFRPCRTTPTDCVGTNYDHWCMTHDAGSDSVDGKCAYSI